MAYDNQYSGGQKPQGRPQIPSQELPEGYLQGGYYKAPSTEGGASILRKEYIVGYPKEIAGALNWDRDKNKNAQVRKYYDYCIRLRDLMLRGKTFAEIESDFCRLSIFVDNAEKRGRVSRLFVKFIDKNIENIHTEKDFYAFVKHFEAVIAHLRVK